MSDTSNAVLPNLSCESHSGTSWPIDAHMCSSGFIFLPVMPNGMVLGEWLCTTDMTSGRASYIAPWMKRSR